MAAGADGDRVAVTECNERTIDTGTSIRARTTKGRATERHVTRDYGPLELGWFEGSRSFFFYKEYLNVSGNDQEAHEQGLRLHRK